MLLLSHWKRWAYLVFKLQPIPVGRTCYPGRSSRCCQVRATIVWKLFSFSPKWALRREHDACGTPSTYTNRIPNQHSLHPSEDFMPSEWLSWGTFCFFWGGQYQELYSSTPGIFTLLVRLLLLTKSSVFRLYAHEIDVVALTAEIVGPLNRSGLVLSLTQGDVTRAHCPLSWDTMRWQKCCGSLSKNSYQFLISI